VFIVQCSWTQAHTCNSKINNCLCVDSRRGTFFVLFFFHDAPFRRSRVDVWLLYTPWHIDLKGFWWWCMLYRIHRIFLDFFHRPVFQKTQRFGNWICFRPQEKVGEKTPTQLGPLERANLNHWNTGRWKKSRKILWILYNVTWQLKDQNSGAGKHGRC
jgi:hypothetical protein